MTRERDIFFGVVFANGVRNRENDGGHQGGDWDNEGLGIRVIRLFDCYWRRY